MGEGCGCNVSINITFCNMLCCHNPGLGLATKARAWKGAGRKCNLGITFTHLGVRECEGMNPHTPKWTPTLGVGVLMDF